VVALDFSLNPPISLMLEEFTWHHAKVTLVVDVKTI
jgi:hypothetical protein